MMQMEEEEEEEEGSTNHSQDVFGEVTSNSNGISYGVDGHKGGLKGMELPFHAANDIPTPTSSIRQMTYFRNLTQSLGASLTNLSEHAQVNGANTADAGRKLRALKNKIVELKTDLDTAERSRSRIEILEAGSGEVLSDISHEEDVPDPVTSRIPTTPQTANGAVRLFTKRMDGRQLVEEQLRGFRLALADAATKTEAIMSR